VKELITAFKIETVYSKDEILETYLNTVPFLYNAYGVEMAARTYFGKSADQLDIARKRDAGRHAQGQQLLQPGAESGARGAAAQPRARADGGAAHAVAATARAIAAPAAHRFRAADRAARPRAALRRATAQMADHVGRSQQLHLYSDGLVVRTTLDAQLQQMATRARAADRALQAVADGAWRGASGCGLRNDLFRGFIRQSADYRAARDAGSPTRSR
jgi:penicillin-binding protein 1A